MLNEFIISLSANSLKDLLLFKLTILNVALAYILMFVIYKALGRYVYFKPQEHASKINRTFLAISLLVVSIHVLSRRLVSIPVLPNYAWLDLLCCLVLIIAPLSIFIDRLIWKYDENGDKISRKWHYSYLPIARDYYKTNVTLSSQEGNSVSFREEEGVESTSKNIHSDALLNLVAVIIFVVTSFLWAQESVSIFGLCAVLFWIVLIIPIVSLFIDQAIFSWIDYSVSKFRQAHSFWL